MKGVLSWLVSWASRAGIRDFCSVLAALVGPCSTNVLSSPYTISIPLVTIGQQAGQAAVLGRLPLM
jgi:hypothetical protein